MKFLVRITLSALLISVCIIPLNAQNTEYAALPVSVMFTGTRPCEYSVYTSRNSSQEVNALHLSSGGHQITEDIKYVAGRCYVDVTPQSYGEWYLLVYTSNPGGQDNSNLTLFGGGDNPPSLIWKYRNQVPEGTTEINEVGQQIPLHQWQGVAGGLPEYKYLYNVAPGSDGASMTQESREYASIVNYKTDSNTWKFRDRIELLFGIDLSSNNANGTYTTTIYFEVYCAP